MSLILAVSTQLTQPCFLAITTENFGVRSYTRAFLASIKENIKDFVLASSIGSFQKKKKRITSCDFLKEIIIGCGQLGLKNFEREDPL